MGSFYYESENGSLAGVLPLSRQFKVKNQFSYTKNEWYVQFECQSLLKTQQKRCITDEDVPGE